MAFKGQMASGTVEGTGSAINVSTGFTPTRVEIINIDGDAYGIYTSDMPDASVYKFVAAGTNSHATTNGVTPYAGVAAGAEAGFTIGADADLNASAETIVWTAWAAE